MDWPAYGMLAFHLYRWNQLKVIPVACTARTRRAPSPKKTLLCNVHIPVVLQKCRITNSFVWQRHLDVALLLTLE